MATPGLERPAASSASTVVPRDCAIAAIASGVRSVRVARMHRHHVDALRAELVRQVLGDRGHADVAQRRHRPTCLANGQTSDVDDAPPAIGDQMRRRGPCRAQVPDDLDVDVALEVVIDEGRAGRGRRRRVDQDVEPAELGHGAVLISAATDALREVSTATA